MAIPTPFSRARAKSGQPITQVAERKLTKDELKGRMEFIKPQLDKLGLNNLQGSAVYQNYKKEYDDYGNQLRAYDTPPAPVPPQK